MSRKIGTRYNSVKNLIHNEMGISKLELRDMIQDIFRQEILCILKAKPTLIDDIVVRHVNHLVEQGLTTFGRGNFKDRVVSQLSTEVSKFVYDKLAISVLVKEDE